MPSFGFDLDAKIVRAFLDDVEIQHFGRDADVVLINNDVLEIPIPAGNPLLPEQSCRRWPRHHRRSES